MQFKFLKLSFFFFMKSSKFRFQHMGFYAPFFDKSILI